ncbi:FAD:protein FMN transferase [Salinibaculum rarum]|uniref:FAD:protein FMN transferase n=1 Tax=Salinibaculum rarum TaxID=3058903 RepID=UPI00265DD08D|nr:FAD:protein FMN transferase [Salinibaculum sp. KK48]
MAGRLAAVVARLGTATTDFDCCDTSFTIEVNGPGADRALERAERTARDLEAQLDAFRDGSAVSRLNKQGSVDNEHVARLLERALEIHDRTGGAFDVRRGQLEHSLKEYLRGDADTPPEPTESGYASVSIEGTTVETTAPLDLNGLAKGYIVDEVHAVADGFGRTAFVSGGGDMTPPPGVVGVESPWDTGSHLTHLETDWAVATSGGYRRERSGHDHIYDPRDAAVGGEHDLVTVLAARDCTTADALATTLSALPHTEALALADGWDGIEALLVTDGVFRRTAGFEGHVATA